MNKEDIVSNFINSYIEGRNLNCEERDKTILIKVEKRFPTCGSVNLRIFTSLTSNKGSVIRVTDFYTTDIDKPLEKQGSLSFGKYDLIEFLNLFD